MLYERKAAGGGGGDIAHAKEKTERRGPQHGGSNSSIRFVVVTFSLSSVASLDWALFVLS